MIHNLFNEAMFNAKESSKAPNLEKWEKSRKLYSVQTHIFRFCCLPTVGDLPCVEFFSDNHGSSWAGEEPSGRRRIEFFIPVLIHPVQAVPVKANYALFELFRWCYRC